MAGRGHATAAPRRVRKARRLMTNLRVDPLHFSPESRWRALAPLEPRSSQLLRRRALLARVGGGGSEVCPPPPPPCPPFFLPLICFFRCVHRPACRCQGACLGLYH